MDSVAEGTEVGIIGEAVALSVNVASVEDGMVGAVLRGVVSDGAGGNHIGDFAMGEVIFAVTGVEAGAEDGAVEVDVTVVNLSVGDLNRYYGEVPALPTISVGGRMGIVCTSTSATGLTGFADRQGFSSGQGRLRTVSVTPGEAPICSPTSAISCPCISTV